MLFASLFIAVALAQYQTIEVYNNDGCSGDPLYWLTTDLGTTCVTISCVGAGGYSTQTSCSDSAPSIPSGLVGWSEYSTSDCTGSPNTISGYTSGCVGYSGLSYQTDCVTGAISFNEYASGDCSGTATATETYQPGCISAGGSSISQSSCTSGGTSVDWNGYLKTWLNNVGQGWVIATFSSTSYYSSHGTWTNTDNSASCTITFTSSQDSATIDTFVQSTCSDMKGQASAGVCTTASTTECASNPDSVSIVSCTWTVATAKRQSTASSINFNAQMSSGFTLTGLFALCLSCLMVLLF